MAKQTKRRVRAVAIFVIFLALAWAGAQTMKHRDRKPDEKSIFSADTAQFNKLPALNKVTINVHSLNKSSAEKAMVDVLSRYSTKKHLDSFKNGYGRYIFQVSSADYPKVLDALGKVGNLGDREDIVDDTLATKNLASEQAKLDTKRKDLAELYATKSAYGSQYNEKKTLEDEIQKLENFIVTPLQQSDTKLLYVRIIPTIGGNSFDIVTSFVKEFGMALLVLFIGTIIAYYGTKLLMYLLNLLGVKGFNVGSLGGGSQYGYSNYTNRYNSRYGYRGSKRKVKRIYKNKPGTSENKEEDTEEQK